MTMATDIAGSVTEDIIRYDEAALHVIQRISDAVTFAGFMQLADLLKMPLRADATCRIEDNLLALVEALEPVPLSRHHGYRHLRKAALAFDQFVVEEYTSRAVAHHQLQQIHRDIVASTQDIGRALIDVSSCCGAMAGLRSQLASTGSAAHVQI